MASEQGKEVFAIPGSIHSAQSRGLHWLLKQGAKLVETGQDVLEELRLPSVALPAQADFVGTRLERASPRPCIRSSHIWDLIRLGSTRCWPAPGIDTAHLQAQLLELELEGQVARMPGGRFQRIDSA